MEASTKAGQCLLESPQDVLAPLASVEAGPLLHQKVDKLKELIVFLEAEIDALERTAQVNQQYTSCQLLKAVQKEVPCSFGSLSAKTHITVYEVIGEVKVPKEAIAELGTKALSLKQKPCP